MLFTRVTVQYSARPAPSNANSVNVINCCSDPLADVFPFQIGESFCFLPVDVAELRTTFTEMKNKSAVGWDICQNLRASS